MTAAAATPRLDQRHDKESAALRKDVLRELGKLHARIRELEGQVEELEAGAGGAPGSAQYVTLVANGVLTQERVLTAGANITITDGGPGLPVTIDAASITDEHIEDVVGALVTAGHGVDTTYNDGAGTLTVDVDESELSASLIGGFAEAVDDRVDALIVDGAGIDTDYNDGAGTLTISVDLTEIEHWETIRDFDLSAIADTDFAAGGDGTYNLNDGNGALTFTAGSTANANAASGTNGGFFRKNVADVGDDGASGLRIFHDAGVNTSLGTGAHTSPRLTIPLSSLDPDYDESAEYRLEFLVTRFADSSAGVVATGHQSVLALYQAAGTPTTSTVRWVSVGNRRQGVGSNGPVLCPQNATGQINTGVFTGLPYASGWNAFALQWGPTQIATGYAGQHAGSWPAASAWRTIGATLAGTTEVAAQNLGIITSRDTLVVLAHTSGGTGTGSMDHMYRRFRLRRRLR